MLLLARIANVSCLVLLFGGPAFVTSQEYQEVEGHVEFLDRAVHNGSVTEIDQEDILLTISGEFWRYKIDHNTVICLKGQRVSGWKAIKDAKTATVITKPKRQIATEIYVPAVRFRVRSNGLPQFDIPDCRKVKRAN